MLVLTVHSVNGAPADGPSAQFDELGGTIGRADTNQLVLPDPERSISRVHAQVLHRNGRFVLVDRGSNAVLVNGQPLGNGREATLKDGDRIQVGVYVLEASFGERTRAHDPFADLFGDAPAARPAAPAPAVPDPFARPPAPAPAPAAGDGFPRTAPAPFDPFARPARAPAPAPAAGGGIPADWDPFAPDPVQPAAAPPAAPAAHAPLVPDLPLTAPSSENSLDALFGLGAGAAPVDPLAAAGGGIAAPLNAPNTSRDADPLASLLGGAGPAAPESRPDHAPELNTPWSAAGLQAPPAPPAAPASSAPPAGRAPAGAVFSWEQPSREGRRVARPEGDDVPHTMVVPTRAARPAAPPPPFSEAVTTPVRTPAAAPRAPAPAPARAAAPASPDSAALAAAFAEGLGLPDPLLAQVGPDEMRLLGQLLRAATQGTVELLVSRAALKREMRAEVTVIAARENNPLKFSPTAEVALQYLLGAPRPGFMGPAQAMNDAFDDLRAHQIGMMAGMRSALDGVLRRFDPTELEARIAKRSGLSSVLPSSRKARLWELFQELYGQLSAEASDDFHQLFGKAFVAAYESAIDEIRSDR